MVKSVVARFLAAKKKGWFKMDKDWVQYVHEPKHGNWTFTVKAIEEPYFVLQMKSPGGKDVPPAGTYQLGNQKWRSADEAKHEGNFWIADVEKGGGVNQAGWKKV